MNIDYNYILTSLFFSIAIGIVVYGIIKKQNATINEKISEILEELKKSNIPKERK